MTWKRLIVLLGSIATASLLIGWTATAFADYYAAVTLVEPGRSRGVRLSAHSGLVWLSVNRMPFGWGTRGIEFDHQWEWHSEDKDLPAPRLGEILGGRFDSMFDAIIHAIAVPFWFLLLLTLLFFAFLYRLAHRRERRHQARLSSMTEASLRDE